MLTCTVALYRKGLAVLHSCGDGMEMLMLVPAAPLPEATCMRESREEDIAATSLNSRYISVR